jgi:hypothetical protein
VYSLARHDPQALAFTQGLPAEQTSAASRSVIGYFHTMRNHSLRSQVVNLEHARGVTTLFYAIGLQAGFRRIPGFRGIHRCAHSAVPQSSGEDRKIFTTARAFSL